VVATCGVREQRSDGKLPAHVITYLTLGLCLFSDDPYEEVATRLTGTLDQWGCWSASWSVPTASAITQARKRLGREVFPALFERIAGPVAGDVSPIAGMVATGAARGAFLRGWRVMAVDGFVVDVPNTSANIQEFGYAGSGVTQSVFPKVRVIALVECGTHAAVAAEVAPYGIGEKTMAQRLYPRLRSDELLTADRNFYSWDAWGEASRTGAALVWRISARLNVPITRVLPDGTFLSALVSPRVHSPRRDRILAAARAGRDVFDPVEVPEAFDRDGQSLVHMVRVIEYDVPDREGNGRDELIALITTIVDPAQATAEELASVYHERWEEETAIDQLKTHLRGPDRVLRSRLPDLAYQEIWAYLIVHHAICALIARASAAADIDPDRVSFTKTLRLVRRSATGTADIPPSGLD
jgi:hypothetical protein